VYGDQTAVLGPLATFAEPHAYDLCEEHSERLSAPRGWEVLRLAPDPDALGPTSDDLLALADAVREAARPAPAPQSTGTTGPVAGRPGAGHAAGHGAGHAAGHGAGLDGGREVGRRGHLRVLRSTDD
jgi:hypothetical protein